MTPPERSLHQHQQQQQQQQQHSLIPSKPSSSSCSSDDSLPAFHLLDQSHNGSLSHDSLPSLDTSQSLSPSPPPYQQMHWPHQVNQSSPDLTMHRPSHQYTASDHQQGLQGQQAKPQQQQQYHRYQNEFPPFANTPQRLEASRGERTMSSVHSPARNGGQSADYHYSSYALAQQPHHWPTYQEREQESFDNQYPPYHGHQNSTHMQSDHPTMSHSPITATQEPGFVAGRVDMEATGNPARYYNFSKPSRQSTFPSSSSEHGVSETRLDSRPGSGSGLRTVAHSEGRQSPAAGMSHQQATATYTRPSSTTMSDRHYVLTSSVSSTNITQQRLAKSQQQQSGSRFDAPEISAFSPGAEHSSSVTTSRVNSVEASPATSRTAGDHFRLDLMPGREKTPRTPQRIPPPILTTWGSDDATRECPPLSFQSNSSQSVSIRSADSKMSPSTPRSTLVHPLLGRPILDHSMPVVYDKPYLPAHTIQQPLFLTQSPVGYNEIPHSYQEEHDMEHCSEQDDVHARVHGDDDDDDEDEDEDEDDNQRVTKRAHLDANVGQEQDDGEEENVRPSSSSSPKTSVTNSPQRNLLKPAKKSTRKAPSPRRAVRPSSLQVTTTDESSEHMEDGGNGPDHSGAHSLHGKGLGYYAPLLCERVQARGTTTLNELVQELAGGQPGDTAEMSPQEQTGQGNIRRRVYDALNILESLGIISMDKKAIRWIGIHNSCIIREATKRVGLQEILPARTAFQEGDRADESEEPEDDDMDIEQLQKEVDALKLQNQLEKAKIEDQLARHVQVNDLIKRNKLIEEQEVERLEQRRLRRLERKAERRTQEAREGSLIPGHPQTESLVDETGRARMEKKSHRHHRHRSPGAQSQQVESEEAEDSDAAVGAHEPRRVLEDGTSMEVDSGDQPQTDEDEARRLRKAQRQERRERRERKEKRAQRRQERETAARVEQGQIGLPCIIIRMPGYGAQSSDSEGCISVVRRVREEPRPRKSHGSKSKHQEEEVDMMTTVEVKVSQQEELSVISDTEILSELRGMLPPNHKGDDSVRSSTATVDDLEKAAAAVMAATLEVLAATTTGGRSSLPPQAHFVPGFERQVLQDYK